MGRCIRYSPIWHDPVTFPVIGPSVLRTANQNARVITQKTNSRPSDCIAANYKIDPIKIADKLAIKITCDKKWCVYLARCWRSSINMMFIQLVKQNSYTPFVIIIILLLLSWTIYLYTYVYAFFFARNSQLRIKQNTEQIQIYSKTVQHNTGCNIHT